MHRYRELQTLCRVPEGPLQFLVTVNLVKTLKSVAAGKVWVPMWSELHSWALLILLCIP